MVAAAGEVFPPGAEGVAPLLKRVLSVRPDGAVMQVISSLYMYIYIYTCTYISIYRCIYI